MASKKKVISHRVRGRFKTEIKNVFHWGLARWMSETSGKNSDQAVRLPLSAKRNSPLSSFVHFHKKPSCLMPNMRSGNIKHSFCLHLAIASTKSMRSGNSTNLPQLPHWWFFFLFFLTYLRLWIHIKDRRRTRHRELQRHSECVGFWYIIQDWSLYIFSNLKSIEPQACTTAEILPVKAAARTLKE